MNCSAEEIWEEIAALRKQQQECVGRLYPSIIEDQITALKDKLKEQLKQTDQLPEEPSLFS